MVNPALDHPPLSQRAVIDEHEAEIRATFD
jgi:hypothetical protein